jgi:uncharacterized membrane protein (DUF485 family)
MMNQKILSAIMMTFGLFVLLIASSEGITGNVVGEGSSSTMLNLVILFWSAGIVITGVWIWFTKDFYNSIFDD